MTDSKFIRTSDQLPDDVGTVFITDVPGSWIQVFGRRAYGHLWVGRCLIQAEGQESPAVVLARGMPGAEIVRGPEAEALLKQVDEFHGEKIWREGMAQGVKPAFVRSSGRRLQ